MKKGKKIMAIFCNFVVSRAFSNGDHYEVCVNLDQISHFSNASGRAGECSMILSIRDEDNEPVVLNIVGDLSAMLRKLKSYHIATQYDEGLSDADI